MLRGIKIIKGGRYLNVVFVILIVFFIFLLGLFIGNIEDENVQKLEFNGGKQVHSTIVAVDAMNKGIMANLTTEVRDGSGLVLLNINDVLADVNAQYSARVAAQVAREYTDVDLHDKDIIFNVMANASVVGGQSAGGAMALSILSLILDKEINESVVITGSIFENGSIGEASKIYEKAKAVKENGGGLLLVPVGTGETVNDYRKIRKCGEYGGKELCETKFEEVIINFGDELGIGVLEVETVKDAMLYYLI